jgi:hypothetical protein
MAIGLPASYEIEIDLIGDRQAARNAVVYSFDILGWKYSTSDLDHFQTTTSINPSSWGERVSVALEDGSIKIRSVCRSPIQIFDWGKNKQNVDRFLIHYSQKELRDHKIRTDDPTHWDDSGKTPLQRALTDE